MYMRVHKKCTHTSKTKNGKINIWRLWRVQNIDSINAQFMKQDDIDIFKSKTISVNCMCQGKCQYWQ